MEADSPVELQEELLLLLYLVVGAGLLLVLLVGVEEGDDVGEVVLRLEDAVLLEAVDVDARVFGLLPLDPVPRLLLLLLLALDLPHEGEEVLEVVARVEELLEGELVPDPHQGLPMGQGLAKWVGKAEQHT